MGLALEVLMSTDDKHPTRKIHLTKNPSGDLPARYTKKNNPEKPKCSEWAPIAQVGEMCIYFMLMKAAIRA